MNELILQVEEASSIDVGLGRARIDAKTRELLGVDVGEIVEIEGLRLTAARVFRAKQDDESKAYIRIDSYTRKNARVTLGDKVKVRKANPQVAQKIVFAPLIRENQRFRFVSRIGDFIRKSLINRPVVVGDDVAVPNMTVFDRPVVFRVVKTVPSEGVLRIDYSTGVEVREEFTSDEMGCADKEIDVEASHACTPMSILGNCAPLDGSRSLKDFEGQCGEISKHITARRLLDEALYYAEGMTNKNRKDRLQGAILAELAKVETGLTLMVQDDILKEPESDVNPRERVLRCLAIMNMEDTLNRILNKVKDIKCDFIRVSVLGKVGLELLKVDAAWAREVFKDALGVLGSRLWVLFEYYDRSPVILDVEYRYGRNAIKDLFEVFEKIDEECTKRLMNWLIYEAKKFDKCKSRKKESALRFILDYIVGFDVDRAVEEASGIRAQNYRAKALSSVAIKVAERDINRARDIARKIEHEDDRDMVCGMIKVKESKMVARRDVDKALQIAESIKDLNTRMNALKEIAIEAAKISQDRALEIARGIENDVTRDEAFKEMAIEVAKVDVKRALEIVECIRNPLIKDGALRGISVEVAKGDKDMALDIAREIKSATERDSALHGIVREIARKDVKRALDMAKGVEDPYWKTIILESIALAILE